MTTEPCVDPIPAEARDILRKIADELRRTPRPVMADPDEVARIIARTAARIEGVAAIARPTPSPTAWRAPITAPECASTPAVDVVTAMNGREVAIERRRNSFRKV